MAKKNASERVGFSFVPLREAAVEENGRVPVKIIAPGWGSYSAALQASAYYPAEVLRRDGPRVFPAGTKMFWNHATATEDAERPEGDLNKLTGKLLTEAIYREDGPAGPGLYADAEVYESYRAQVDEKTPALSIRAFGRVVPGEADGKRGKIVQELLAAKSVDWVTEAGAGGQIVMLEEAARDTEGDIENLQEAHNMAEWLESRLHLHLTEIADDLFGWGYVTREERITLSSAIGDALTTYHDKLMSDAPQLFERGRWDEPADMTVVTESATPEAAAVNTVPAERLSSAKETKTMSTEQLQEAQDRIAALEDERQADQATIARLLEMLLLREARDFVSGRLAQTDLPEVTQIRLVRELVANPPLTEAGQLDETAFTERVDQAVETATAEIAAITESVGSGRIRGMGVTRPAGGATEKLVTLEEAQKRIDGALNRLAYRPVSG